SAIRRAGLRVQHRFTRGKRRDLATVEKLRGGHELTWSLEQDGEVDQALAVLQVSRSPKKRHGPDIAPANQRSSHERPGGKRGRLTHFGHERADGVQHRGGIAQPWGVNLALERPE